MGHDGNSSEVGSSEFCFEEHLVRVEARNSEMWSEQNLNVYKNLAATDVPVRRDPVSLETPGLWVSKALTTPTDDDVQESPYITPYRC